MVDQSERQPSGQPLAIPDGGLQSALPEWMQAKPDWTERQEPDGPTVVQRRPVPEPEASAILLVDIVTVDNLPDWLREVAARPRTATEESAEPVESAPELTQPTPQANQDYVDALIQPWWASDRVMAGLLIAVIVTLFFVLISTARLL